MEVLPRLIQVSLGVYRVFQTFFWPAEWFIVTPVDIGDTHGNLQAKKKRLKHSINAQRHLYESTWRFY